MTGNSHWSLAWSDAGFPYPLLPRRRLLVVAWELGLCLSSQARDGFRQGALFMPD
jgi:hypothetical protein